MNETPRMTASAFSRAVGADRHQLSKKLAELKSRPVGKKNGGELFTLRDLVQAHVGGDERAERIRKLRAESERLEIQNARSHGELVEVVQVKKLGQQVMSAIKQKIMSFPISDGEKDKLLADLLSLREMNFSD